MMDRWGGPRDAPGRAKSELGPPHSDRATMRLPGRTTGRVRLARPDDPRRIPMAQVRSSDAHWEGDLLGGSGAGEQSIGAGQT